MTSDDIFLASLYSKQRQQTEVNIKSKGRDK